MSASSVASACPAQTAVRAVPDAPKLEFRASRQFTAWMAEQHLSLAFTTYQLGKCFMLGLQPDGRLDLFNRSFNRSMGLAVADQTLYLSTLYQLWRFDNILPEGETHNGYDRMYVPQVAWTTGDLDIHDVAVDRSRQPVFVNTLFGCVATVSEEFSFKPLWQPPFLSKLAAEDRCHLNGLALVDGRPRFVTSVARSDIADGWRDKRTGGGVVIDIDSNEIMVEGLSMPHSPRWHHDRLWLLDSGTGYFGYVDQARQTFERVAFCPGFSRGLAFIGDFAVIGLSRPRKNGNFSGLPLDEELRRRDASPHCGLQVVDLRSGDAVHWLRLTGMADELYDVAALPGIQRPMMIGLLTDEIRRLIRLPQDAHRKLSGSASVGL